MFKKLKKVIVFLFIIPLSFISCSDSDINIEEPSTALAPYYIDCFRSITDADGHITFSWEYVSNDFDSLQIKITQDDGSIIYEETITDNTINSYILSGEAGKIYSYSFTPYSNTGEVGKTFTGTRYIPANEIQKNLPTLVISTKDNEWPDCDFVAHPEGSCGAGITNNDYVLMNAILYNTDGSTLYSTSSEYESKIKIRGNTSAYGDKKPYKIKLNKASDILAPITGRTGKQYKDKEWLLMTSGTSVNNVIGFAANEYLGIEYTPSYAYIELIVNGDYRGVYMIVESVKQGKVDEDKQSRCQVDDDGYVFENDPYWWNEEIFFRTDKYHFQYTFKYPDPDDITQDQINFIKNYMDAFETALSKDDDSYLDYIDADSFVSWVMVHEYLGAYDGAGTNQYLMMRNSNPETKVEMTTTWDYDGIMNTAELNSHATVNSLGFFFTDKLLAKESFHNLCSEKYLATKSGFVAAINSKIDALNESNINSARQNDALRWNNTATTIATQKATFNSWINQRFTFLESEYNN